MKMLSRTVLALGLVVLSHGALNAQGTVLQGGPWTPGHAPQYVGQGGSQPVIQDGGSAGGGISGANISEIGVVARGSGPPPYAGQGSGQFGTNICDYDAPINNATGYHFICLSANAQGGGLLAFGSAGGASQLPFQFNYNGLVYEFPFTTNGALGPTTTTVGDLAVWNNTAGTLLKDVSQITLAQMPSIAPTSVLCNATGSPATPIACTTLKIGAGSFSTAFANGMEFGVSNTPDTSWTPLLPMLGLVASEGAAGVGNNFVGFYYNNLPPATFALPAGIVGFGKLASGSYGNAVFGLYGVAETYSTGGGSAIAAEVTCRNFSGSAPDASLPPNSGIGTSTTVCNALNVTAGGTQNSSIGVAISSEGGSTKQFNTGLFLNNSSWIQYGIYVSPSPSFDAVAAGVFFGNIGINNNAPFSPLTVTAAAGDSFELRSHHLLASGPTLVGTDTGKAEGSPAPVEIWGNKIYLNSNGAGVVIGTTSNIPADTTALTVQGQGNTSGSFSAVFTNSDAAAIFAVRDDGVLLVGISTTPTVSCTVNTPAHLTVINGLVTLCN